MPVKVPYKINKIKRLSFSDFIRDNNLAVVVDELKDGMFCAKFEPYIEISENYMLYGTSCWSSSPDHAVWLLADNIKGKKVKIRNGVYVDCPAEWAEV